MLEQCTRRALSVGLRGRRETHFDCVCVVLVLRSDDGVDSTSDVKIADHGHALGLGGLHEIIQNLVGHRLVKMALIAEGPKIQLERLELDAARARNVPDPKACKVWLARLRTKARELGALKGDLVGPLWVRVREGFELFGHDASLYTDLAGSASPMVC